MSIRDRIRSRNGLIMTPAARPPRSFVKPDGGGPRLLSRGSVATPSPPPFPAYSRDYSGRWANGWCEGHHWHCGGARGTSAPRQIRPEDASPADPVVIRVYPLPPCPSSASVFSFLPCSLSFPPPPSLPPPSRPHTRDLRAWFNASRALRSLFMHRTCIHALSLSDRRDG